MIGGFFGFDTVVVRTPKNTKMSGFEKNRIFFPITHPMELSGSVLGFYINSPCSTLSLDIPISRFGVLWTFKNCLCGVRRRLCRPSWIQDQCAD